MKSPAYRTAKDLFRIKLNALTEEDFIHAQKTGEGNNVVGLDYAHYLMLSNEALELYDVYYFKNHELTNQVLSATLLGNNHVMRTKIFDKFLQARRSNGRINVEQFIEDYAQLPVKQFCEQYKIPYIDKEVAEFHELHLPLTDVIPEALTRSTAELLNFKFAVRVYKNKRFEKSLDVAPYDYPDTRPLNNEQYASTNITYSDEIETMLMRFRQFISKLIRRLAEFIFGNRHNSQMMADTRDLNVVEFTERYPYVNLTADDINQQYTCLLRKESETPSVSTVTNTTSEVKPEVAQTRLTPKQSF